MTVMKMLMTAITKDEQRWEMKMLMRQMKMKVEDKGDEMIQLSCSRYWNGLFGNAIMTTVKDGSETRMWNRTLYDSDYIS